MLAEYNCTHFNYNQSVQDPRHLCLDLLVGSLKSILGHPPAEIFPFLLWRYWWQQWVIMLSMKRWCCQIMTELFEWKITVAFNTGKAMCHRNLPLRNCWAVVYVSYSGVHLQNILTSWFLGIAYTLRSCGFGSLLFPQCLIPAPGSQGAVLMPLLLFSD